jgi:hypothetical protein
MKKALLVVLGLIVLLSGIGVYHLYRSETAIPDESDLARYPEMSAFLAGRTGFRGIRFDVDTNYYSFAFPTTLPSAESYFQAIHSVAAKAGWHLANAEPKRRVYARRKSPPIESFESEKVTLIYDSEKLEVTVIREDTSG